MNNAKNYKKAFDVQETKLRVNLAKEMAGVKTELLKALKDPSKTSDSLNKTSQKIGILLQQYRGEQRAFKRRILASETKSEEAAFEGAYAAKLQSLSKSLEETQNFLHQIDSQRKISTEDWFLLTNSQALHYKQQSHRKVLDKFLEDFSRMRQSLTARTKVVRAILASQRKLISQLSHSSSNRSEGGSPSREARPTNLLVSTAWPSLRLAYRNSLVKSAMNSQMQALKTRNKHVGAQNALLRKAIEERKKHIALQNFKKDFEKLNMEERIMLLEAEHQELSQSYSLRLESLLKDKYKKVATSKEWPLSGYQREKKKLNSSS